MSSWKQRAFSITRASWFRLWSYVTHKLMSLSHFISQKHIQDLGLCFSLIPLTEFPRRATWPIAKSTWVLPSRVLGGSGKTSIQIFASSGCGRSAPVRMLVMLASPFVPEMVYPHPAKKVQACSSLNAPCAERSWTPSLFHHVFPVNVAQVKPLFYHITMLFK